MQSEISQTEEEKEEKTEQEGETIGGIAVPSEPETVPEDDEPSSDKDMRELTTNERVTDHDVLSAVAKAEEDAESPQPLETAQPEPMFAIPEVKTAKPEPAKEVEGQPAGPEKPVLTLDPAPVEEEDAKGDSLEPRVLKGKELRQLPSVVGGLARFGINAAGIDEGKVYLSGKGTKVFLDNQQANQQLLKLLQPEEEA